MRIHNIVAIFKKQVKETFKNKSVLLQFMMFPALVVIMANSLQIEGMPSNFWVKVFGCMFVGMAPLTNMSAIIAEEKEKNTLRVLMMSNVKPAEYLIGIGSYIWIICMLGSCVFAGVGGYKGSELAFFFGIMAVGILTSIMMGAAVGVCSKNQMSANAITVPVMMIFSFLPMLSMFNKTIAKVAKIAYSQQINLLMDQVSNLKVTSESVIVIGMNILVTTIIFTCAYKKSGLA